MGQTGSSELRLSPTAGAGAADSSAEPPLRWLRVSRASSSSLAAEWGWSPDSAGRVGRCHLLFLRSDSTWQSSRPMQRVQVDPELGSYTMLNLSEDSPYRVCLQCAANFTMDVGAARAPEAMHCVNVSTKQAHLPAIIGSCLGALCALILVLALLLISRRTQKYRKVNERQPSASKKVVVHEIAYQTDNLPTPKIDIDSNSDGYVYDGSEEQQGSTVSDDTLTPPPIPPPPPPVLQSATSEIAIPLEKDKGAHTADHLSERPDQENESLLPSSDQSQLQPAQLDQQDSSASEASSDSVAKIDVTVAPPPPPSPPHPVEPDNEASAPVSTPASASADCRQVIQVNETDEYSIDLRLCSSLSRQQSLRATSGPGSSSGVGSTQSEEQRTAVANVSSSTVQGSESQQDGQAVNSVPSLYTQLIETL